MSGINRMNGGKEDEKKEDAPKENAGKDEKKEEKKEDAGKEDAGKDADKKKDAKPGDEDDPCKKDAKSPDCIGKKVADNIQLVLDEPLNFAGKQLSNVASAVMKKTKKIVTDKTECVKFFVNEIPNFLPNFISHVGDATSNSIDKITNSVKNLFEEFTGQDIPGYPNIIPPLETLYASAMMKIQSAINTTILGADGNKIMADPNTKPKVLLEKLEANSINFKKMISDDQFKEIFKKWMINYTSAFAESLKLAEPQLNQLKAMMEGVIGDISKKLGTTLGKALFDLIKSAVGEIPVAGGVLDLIISIIQMGENIVKSCLPIISKGAGVVLPPLNIINKKYEETKHDLKCLSKKIEPIMKKIENMSTPTANNNEKKQTGGEGNIHKGNIHKKIQRSTKRIKRMLNLFTRKKNSKPTNYAKQLLKLRN